LFDLFNSGGGVRIPSHADQDSEMMVIGIVGIIFIQPSSSSALGKTVADWLLRWRSLLHPSSEKPASPLPPRRRAKLPPKQEPQLGLQFVRGMP
jgi:hypothetical protein